MPLASYRDTLVPTIQCRVSVIPALLREEACKTLSRGNHGKIRDDPGTQRYRKYKQVLEDKLVSAELSIRFWAHHRNFWNWCIHPGNRCCFPRSPPEARASAYPDIAAPTQFSFHCTVVFARAEASLNHLTPPMHRGSACHTCGEKRRKKAVLRHRPGAPCTSLCHLRQTVLLHKRGHMDTTHPSLAVTLNPISLLPRLRSNEFSYPALCALHRMAKHLPAYMAPNALRAITSALRIPRLPPSQGAPTSTSPVLVS